MIYKLRPGNDVKVIAPSSCIDNEKDFLNGLKIIESWGLNIGHNYLLDRKFGYFSGNDDIRFNELEKGQNSQLIICARGGWGSSRLLEKNLRWENKWLLGFSDNCSLLLSKYSNGSFGSIHGPTLSTLSNEPNWSINRLKSFLFEGYLDDIKGTPLNKGFAKGNLIVTNLTIFCYLVGTNHLPNCDGKIVVFEDVNEDIYKIDRMFTYLRISKVLDKIVGIGFGYFFDKTAEEEQRLLKSLIIDRFQEFDIPIVFNLPIGHSPGNACVPLGFMGVLNGNNGRLSVNLNNN